METRDIDVPVDEVILLEDRARVIRRGRVELAAGSGRVRIAGVAPVAADKTLAVVIEGDGARAVDARIRRRAVVRQIDDESGAGAGESAAAALERERDGLDARIDVTRSARDVAAREAAALDRVAVLTHAELAEDASWGRSIGTEWAQRLDELRAQERAALARVADGDRDLAELARLRQRLEVRIMLARTPAEEERADLEVDLLAERAGTFALRVDYVVPGACWRPYHTARLQGGRIELTTDACVWQNTGEDWRDAQLVLSTERGSLGSDPPRLHTDQLRWQKRSEAIVVEAREQHIDTAGLGAAAAAPAPELPGIDDGGEPLALRAPARATVPSDGRPWRVRLSGFTADAELAHVAFPELSPCVLLRATLVNGGDTPLLAGPVDLIRDSGLVGRTSILYIAPDERFELGFGPDADLRIHRDEGASDEKSRALSSWVTRVHTVDVRLSNLGASPRTVAVTERIPVSELEKVKIAVDAERTTRGARPDGDGFVTWTVDLPPRGHQELTLVYELRKHEDVVGL
jgi:uncharacterized protein (TIGR02231 family)